jgi:hypothetical protein
MGRVNPVRPPIPEPIGNVGLKYPRFIPGFRGCSFRQTQGLPNDGIEIPAFASTIAHKTGILWPHLSGSLTRLIHDRPCKSAIQCERERCRANHLTTILTRISHRLSTAAAGQLAGSIPRMPSHDIFPRPLLNTGEERKMFDIEGLCVSFENR